MATKAREQVRGIGGLSSRDATLLAWSLCALSLALTAVSLLLFALNLSHPNTHTYDPGLDNTLIGISYAPIGALIASHVAPQTP